MVERYRRERRSSFLKTGRNEPCPCGSGLKFKKCHGGPKANTFGSIDHVGMNLVGQMKAREQIRERQQGLGRPIVSFKLGDQQMVAVNKTVYHSSNWKTFIYFLSYYIKRVLGEDWGNSEIAKPIPERHTILKWYDEVCRYQSATIKTPGEVTAATMTGVVCCYFGLAYSLFLLDHNVELQKRLVKRLKDPANFQGAYYELVVANSLIRAGFELALENETDGTAKHCEFSATSKRTGKKYWVEAKARSVIGMLGKTVSDGTTKANPVFHLVEH